MDIGIDNLPLTAPHLTESQSVRGIISEHGFEFHSQIQVPTPGLQPIARNQGDTSYVTVIEPTVGSRLSFESDKDAPTAAKNRSGHTIQDEP